ncbi:hypothetical protein EV714DRAFT_240257 [Schizophyllum commune]
MRDPERRRASKRAYYERHRAKLQSQARERYAAARASAAPKPPVAKLKRRVRAGEDIDRRRASRHAYYERNRLALQERARERMARLRASQDLEARRIQKRRATAYRWQYHDLLKKRRLNLYRKRWILKHGVSHFLSKFRGRARLPHGELLEHWDHGTVASIPETTRGGQGSIDRRAGELDDLCDPAFHIPGAIGSKGIRFYLLLSPHEYAGVYLQCPSAADAPRLANVESHIRADVQRPLLHRGEEHSDERHHLALAPCCVGGAALAVIDADLRAHSPSKELSRSEPGGWVGDLGLDDSAPAECDFAGGSSFRAGECLKGVRVECFEGFSGVAEHAALNHTSHRGVGDERSRQSSVVSSSTSSYTDVGSWVDQTAAAVGSLRLDDGGAGQASSSTPRYRSYILAGDGLSATVFKNKEAAKSTCRALRDNGKGVKLYKAKSPAEEEETAMYGDPRKASDKPKNPQGRPSIFTEAQLEFLRKFLEAYQALGRKKGEAFWNAIFPKFFELWPLPELTVDYSDCATEEEREEKLRKAKEKQLQQARDRIKSWFARQTQLQNKATVWKQRVAQMFKPKKGRPRPFTMKNMHKFYMTMDEFKEKVDEAAHDELGDRTLRANENMAHWVKVAQQLWKDEPDDVKTRVAQEAAEYDRERIAEYDLSISIEGLDEKEQAEAREHLVGAMKPFILQILRITGCVTASFIVGLPANKDRPKVRCLTVHIGTTTAANGLKDVRTLDTELYDKFMRHFAKLTNLSVDKPAQPAASTSAGTLDNAEKGPLNDAEKDPLDGMFSFDYDEVRVEKSAEQDEDDEEDDEGGPAAAPRRSKGRVAARAAAVPRAQGGAQDETAEGGAQPCDGHGAPPPPPQTAPSTAAPSANEPAQPSTRLAPAAPTPAAPSPLQEEGASASPRAEDEPLAPPSTLEHGAAQMSAGGATAPATSDEQPTAAPSTSDAQPTAAPSTSDAQPTAAPSTSHEQPTAAPSTSHEQPTAAASASSVEHPAADPPSSNAHGSAAPSAFDGRRDDAQPPTSELHAQQPRTRPRARPAQLSVPATFSSDRIKSASVADALRQLLSRLPPPERERRLAQMKDWEAADLKKANDIATAEALPGRVDKAHDERVITNIFRCWDEGSVAQPSQPATQARKRKRGLEEGEDDRREGEGEGEGEGNAPTTQKRVRRRSAGGGQPARPGRSDLPHAQRGRRVGRRANAAEQSTAQPSSAARSAEAREGGGGSGGAQSADRPANVGGDVEMHDGAEHAQGDAANDDAQAQGNAANDDAQVGQAPPSPPSIFDADARKPLPNYMHKCFDNVSDLVGAEGHAGVRELFKGIVETWASIEALDGNKGLGPALSSKGRPPDVYHWIQRARSTGYKPDLTKDRRKGETERVAASVAFDKFRLDMRTWWARINPTWHTSPTAAGAAFALRRVDGDWSCMLCTGQNGLISVVKCMKWWWEMIGEVDEQPGDRDEWRAAAADVAWAFEQVLKYAQEHPRDGSSEQPPAKRRKT